MKRFLTFLTLLITGFVAFSENTSTNFRHGIGVSYSFGSNDSYFKFKDDGFEDVDNQLNTVELAYCPAEYSDIFFSGIRLALGMNYISGDIDTKVFQYESYGDWYKFDSRPHITLSVARFVGVENKFAGISISDGIRLRAINMSMELADYDSEKAEATVIGLGYELRTEAYCKLSKFRLGILLEFSPIRYDFSYDVRLESGKKLGSIDGEFEWFTNGQFGIFARYCF